MVAASVLRCLWGLSAATPLWSFLSIPKLAFLLGEAHVVKCSHFIEEETGGREGQGLAQGHAGDTDPPLILQMAQACSLHLGKAADGAAPKSQGSYLTPIPTDPVRDSVLAWAPHPSEHF